jgi:fatty-acyl-CoA synthase
VSFSSAIRIADMDVLDMAVEFNLANVFGAVAARHLERPAVVHGEQTESYGALANQMNSLARFLANQGLGCDRERDRLSGHETGQALVGQLMHNSVAYLVGMLGSFRARAVPFNLNYRYTAEELRYVLADACPRAIQFHSAFAPLIAQVRPDLDPETLLLQVPDGSGHPLLSGALDFDETLASTPPVPPDCTPLPDDLFLVYTGGTTGMPKGALWRQADVMVSGLMVVDRKTNREWASLDALLSRVRSAPVRVLSGAPYMHSAGQWVALQALCEGNTVVIQRDGTRFEAADIWDSAEAHRVNALFIVGDALARPLTIELERRHRDLRALRLIVSGGAAMQPMYKDRLQAAIPGVVIVDRVGSSESGPLGKRLTSNGIGDGRAVFEVDDSTVVVSEDRTGFLTPGHDAVGWLGRRGRIPLGYLNDQDKTARSFPVVEGERVALPGDRGRLLSDGRVELLGRDGTVINSGGEKVFAEEVEAVLRSCPGVADALACGRPSERWGTEVVAVVAAAEGATLGVDAIRQHCARQLARYKLPKAIVFVDKIPRSPAGKADYRWAAELVTRS